VRQPTGVGHLYLIHDGGATEPFATTSTEVYVMAQVWTCGSV